MKWPPPLIEALITNLPVHPARIETEATEQFAFMEQPAREIVVSARQPV